MVTPNQPPTPNLPMETAYRARWIIPVDRPPISKGCVVVDKRQIAEVHSNDVGSSNTIDLGADSPSNPLGHRVNQREVAILPGLVNAHTHLEFSLLDEPLTPSRPFADWIAAVVGYRRNVAPPVEKAIAAGLRESLQFGVTALGEISTADAIAHAFFGSPIQSVVFRELLGLSQQRAAENLELAYKHVNSETAEDGLVRLAVSPHAPYSVHPELFAQLVQLAQKAHVPLAFHLAETQEELELLRSGSGPLRELFDRMGVWEPGAIRPSTRPLDYLRQMSLLQCGLVIHGNYLDDEEIAFLAQHPQLTVVYCPRTRQYFQHDDYPLSKLLAAGVSVALGTDSKASNPDLNLFAEMQTVHQLHPEISPEQILRMGTLSGAIALGLEQQTGSLSTGKSANLIAVAYQPDASYSPAELILQPSSEVVGTMIRGQWMT